VGSVIVTVLAAGLAACHAASTAGVLRPACAQPIVPKAPAPTAAGPGGRSIAEPDGAGAITVAAVGFTQDRDGLLSIGAEVSNSGTRIAYDTDLVFHASSSGYGEVLDPQTVRIPVIRPGERVPVGLPATSTEDLAWVSYPEVRSVRVALVRTRWLPASGVGRFPRVSVRMDPSAIKVGRAHDIAEVLLAGTTNACTNEPATRVGVVYRNSAGAIVGGALATTSDIGGVASVPGCVVGGFHGGVFAYGPPPPTAVLPRTEAAVYCDPAKSGQLHASATMQ
jgi:hypothetical protein